MTGDHTGRAGRRRGKFGTRGFKADPDPVLTLIGWASAHQRKHVAPTSASTGGSAGDLAASAHPRKPAGRPSAYSQSTARGRAMPRVNGPTGLKPVDAVAKPLTNGLARHGLPGRKLRLTLGERIQPSGGNRIWMGCIVHRGRIGARCRLFQPDLHVPRYSPSRGSRQRCRAGKRSASHRHNWRFDRRRRRATVRRSGGSLQEAGYASLFRPLADDSKVATAPDFG